MKSINAGCGRRPTPGFINLDGSPSVWLAAYPWIWKPLRWVRLLSHWHEETIRFYAAHDVAYGNVLKRLPLQDSSIDLVYAAHVAEHLKQGDLNKFLDEVWRLLRPGGHLRLAVPDLRRKLDAYQSDRDADAFLKSTGLCEIWDFTSTLRGRLQFFFVGVPWVHKWMYDGESLAGKLRAKGFVEIAIVPAGTTTCPHTESLDLRERAVDSVYVEARKPIDESQ